jgi:AcrR family transcriptional regulator
MVATKIRLTRDDWLRQALDALSEDPRHLRIDDLAERLGVSKGSFYWHFESRKEFVIALAEFWRDTYTNTPGDQAMGYEGTPEERMKKLFELIVRYGYASKDMPIRAFARIEPDIQPIVREVDEIRMNTLRQLFEEMGFTGKELEFRTRLFVVSQSFDPAFSIRRSDEEILAEIDQRVAFFTRR